MDPRFKNRSASLYRGMQARMKRKKLPPLPFTQREFYDHLLTFLGTESGCGQCRYCRGWIDIGTLAVDHAIPLKRGGDIGLPNLEFPCKPCNAQKGGLTPDEFLRLRSFLQAQHPSAMQDVLNRLQIAIQLAGAKAWNRQGR